MINIKRISFVTLLLSLAIGSFYSYKFINKLPKQEPESNWYTTEKSFDIISGSGKFISLKDINRGGITLLPLGYQEKNRDYTISIYDPKTNSESEKNILTDIPENASVKLLQNTINPDRIWVIIFHQVKDCQGANCNFKIAEFDLNSGVTSQKSTVQFHLPGSGKASLHSFIPLLHDPVLNKIWFAFNTIDPKYKYDHFDLSTKKHVVEEKEAYSTSVIAYDVNTGSAMFNKWLMRGVDFNNRLHNYDVDQTGDLYIDTECMFRDCPRDTDNVFNSDYQFYRISPTNQTYNPVMEPIFSYGMRPFLREFTIDQHNSSMYLVNMTWNSGPGSTVIHYDTSRKISSQVGVPPIAYEDDVRGISSIQNKLLIGTFRGLGIYDKQTDKWKMITTNDGIKDDNVELVVPFASGICLRHEGNGSSCHYGSLSQL